MENLFKGIHNLSLDSKGRLGIPVKYRDNIIGLVKGAMVITIDTEEKCLLLYPSNFWSKIQDKISKLPSFNKNMRHLNYSFKKKFEIIGSAHNLKEIRTKEFQKVNKIFLSSIFKKNKNYLGINKFKLLSNLTKKKIVALGGISKKNKKLINILNVKYFAGISYFE